MPPTHADGIAKLVDTMTHLSKAKLTMDSAPEGLFGPSYTGAVSDSRGLINDGLLAGCRGVMAVLQNEEEERNVGVQASLVGETSDELLQQREKKARKAKKKTEPDIALRPTFQVFLHVPSEEKYSVRFYPTDAGPEPTGLHGPFIEDDRMSLDDHANELPALKYDANPDLIDWFKTSSAEFTPEPGLTWPPPAAAAAEPATADATS